MKKKLKKPEVKRVDAFRSIDGALFVTFEEAAMANRQAIIEHELKQFVADNGEYTMDLDDPCVTAECLFNHKDEILKILVGPETEEDE